MTISGFKAFSLKVLFPVFFFLFFGAKKNSFATQDQEICFLIPGAIPSSSTWHCIITTLWLLLCAKKNYATLTNKKREERRAKKEEFFCDDETSWIYFFRGSIVLFYYPLRSLPLSSDNDEMLSYFVTSHHKNIETDELAIKTTFFGLRQKLKSIFEIYFCR